MKEKLYNIEMVLKGPRIHSGKYDEMNFGEFCFDLTYKFEIFPLA